MTGLHGVIVKPPSGLLWIFIAGANIQSVIWRPFLFLATGQHGHNRKTDRLHAQCRGPILGEDGETDMAVAVHVWMHGNILADENNLWRCERVLVAKRELKLEMFSFVQCAVSAIDFHKPQFQRRRRFRTETNTGRRLVDQLLQFLLKSFLQRTAHDEEARNSIRHHKRKHVEATKTNPNRSFFWRQRIIYRSV